MSKILWVFDFGHRSRNPGLSNVIIAREVAKKINRDGDNFFYILSQNGNGEFTSGVGRALLDQGILPDFEVGVSQKGPTAYLETREVAERFLEFHPYQPGDEIWIACHQAAWTGTRKICRSLGVEPRRFLDTRIPYDPLSHQRQARGPVRCLAYKIWALSGYIWRGEIFAFFSGKKSS